VCLAWRLGGEERLEDPLQRRGVHAMTGVGQRQPHIASLVQLRPGAEQFPAGIEALERDLQDTGLAAHCVRGVRIAVMFRLGAGKPILAEGGSSGQANHAPRQSGGADG